MLDFRRVRFFARENAGNVGSDSRRLRLFKVMRRRNGTSRRVLRVAQWGDDKFLRVPFFERRYVANERGVGRRSLALDCRRRRLFERRRARVERGDDVFFQGRYVLGTHMVRETTSRLERRGARAERRARQNRYSARNVGRPARRILSEDSRDGRLPALFRARRLGRNGPNRRRRLALERKNAFSFRQNSKRRRPYSVDGVFARRIVVDRLVREQPNYRL